MKYLQRADKKTNWIAITICTLLIMSTIGPAFAQDKISVQVKTFTKQLEPYRNIEVSINGKPYINVGRSGVVLTDLSPADFPIKSVTVKDANLEAASWLFSKGVVEIIVRNKTYQIVNILVQPTNNSTLAGVKVTYKGKKNLEGTTDSQGKLSFPLALDEQITSPDQLIIPGYMVKKLTSATGTVSLVLEPIADAEVLPEQLPAPTTNTRKDFLKDFKLSMLDSIQSLTLFYSIFKDYQINDLSPEMKRRVDMKFNELVRALQDSVQQDQRTFIGRINESTLVREDITNLISQARQESTTLTTQRDAFDEKIRIITSKLDAGVANMDDNTRTQLLSELSLLERLLIENESRFFKNQSDYRHIINTIREKYFNLTVLEDKLSESEAQRLEEQRIFRQRLLGVSAVVLLFAVLIVLLIIIRKKLKKQTIELARANKEIKHINENLEQLVQQRTSSLAEANKELDTFLYRASHDMRSPVRSIIGLCNIAGHQVEGEVKDLISKVVSTTMGMDRLLKKLSIVSEINEPADCTEINIKDAIADVYKYLNNALGTQTKFSVEVSQDVVIYSHKNLVHTILQNVMENGLIYGSMENSREPELHVHVVNDDKHVSITITDNGNGFDSFIKDRLFDMFFKGTEKSQGHGLGLYIVNKAILALNGNIEVESLQGRYTKFRILLPVHAKNTEAYITHQAVA
jgi:signal transduction histidine kinase